MRRQILPLQILVAAIICALLFNLDPLNLYFSISKFFYLNWILKIYQVHPPTYTLLENIHWKLLLLHICTLTTRHTYVYLTLIYITLICLGVRSIEHPDVLSEKKFSAPGGLKSAKFEPGNLDPIYFEVGNFSASPDPPYMSKNAQMC